MKSIKNNILIAGYYGFHNIGDEAILKSMLDQFRSLRKDLSFTVVSGDPVRTSADHAVTSVHWQDVMAISNSIRSSDLVILGGGGLYHDAYDRWDNPLTDILTSKHKGINYYSCFPILAALYAKPLVLLSLGVGPVITEQGKNLTRFTFKNAQLASVRDPLSKGFLQSLGLNVEDIHIIPDPAFGLTPSLSVGKEILERFKNNDIPGPTLGVCLRNWNIDVSVENWETTISQTLDEFLATTNGQIVFIPFQDIQNDNNSNDILIARTIIEKMKLAERTDIIPNISSPQQNAGIIAHCDLILGMRLHSLIFSIMAGVPLVGLSYDEKIDQLMNQFELGSYLFSIGDFSQQDLLSALQHALKDSRQIKQRLITQSQGMRNVFSEFVQSVLDILIDDPSAKNPPGYENILRDLFINKIHQTILLEKQIEEMVQKSNTKFWLIKKIRSVLAHQRKKIFK